MATFRKLAFDNRTSELAEESYRGRHNRKRSRLACCHYVSVKQAEVYLLQDHHVDQRYAFWEVPQVRNIVVQKIILTKGKKKRTEKLKRDFWS